MTRRITLKKATRIEGNADIRIDIDKGRVQTARLMVHDFRGFEKFCIGAAVEALPQQVSRICGLCCASHQVAALQAIEDALEVTPPAPVAALRRIMLLGEWISSHALSYFFLTLPDAVGTDQGVMDLVRRYPDVMEKAFELRRQGLRIVTLLGKRAVHPVSLGIGCFTIAPSSRELEEISDIGERIRRTVRNLARQMAGLSIENPALDVGDTVPYNFLTYNEENNGAPFTVFNPRTRFRQTFERDSFEEVVGEIRADWTFAKFPYITSLGFPDGILLVGPLARLNQENSILGDPEIRDLAPARRLPAVGQMTLAHTDVCRLLEIYWAAGEIIRLLAGIERDFGRPAVNTAVSGKGIGVVEAPRGVLVHSYLIKRGVLERMQLLVATQFNNPFINLLIKELAQRNVDGEGLSAAGEALIGRCIRTFDPCLSCATH